MAEKLAATAAEATPFAVVAASTYDGAVLAKPWSDVRNVPVRAGVQLLQRVFGRRRNAEDLPSVLIDVIKHPGDEDYVAALRLAIRRALEADETLASEIATILEETRAAAEALQVVSGRDSSVNYFARDGFIAGRDIKFFGPSSSRLSPDAPALGWRNAMLDRILARIFRIRAKDVLLAAVAGGLTGLLSELATGQLAWSVAAGLLLALCVLAASRTVLIASLHAERDLYRAGRDIYQAGIMNVTVRTMKHVTRRSSLPSTVTALVALVLALWGTLYYGTLPGAPLEAILPADVRSSPPITWTASATFQETWSRGDRITQKVSFGDPLPLSRFSNVSAAIQNGACGQVSYPPDGRDLVIPFRIASTLDSSVPDTVYVGMDNGTFFDQNNNSDGLTYAADGAGSVFPLSLVELGGSIDCDLVLNFSSPPTINLQAQHDSVETDGWLVFPDAIDGDDPKGNLAALGQTYAQLEFGMSSAQEVSIKVTGPGVCTSDSTTQGPGNFQGIQNNYPPYLHMTGPEPRWEQCSGHWAGTPTY